MTLFDRGTFDIDGYFERIGYGGPTVPNLELLQAVALLHPTAIPFENLNPLLGRPVPLDGASLQRKLIHERRGGWCFEHNVLLGTALTALGYSVTGLAARVMWNAPAGAVTPRSHMVLQVPIDGRTYIVDAGFGGLTLTGPLRLEADVEQPTPHEPFRLLQRGDVYVVEARVRGEWRALYRFDLQPQTLADYEVTSWYLSTNPRSHFLAGVIAARVQPDRRYALRNTDLAIHHCEGVTDQRALVSAADLREALTTLFGIDVPTGPDVEAAFARVIAPATAATA